MKATLSARQLEHGHFQFLPENGVKITKNAKAKTKVNGARRTDGNYPRVIDKGDILVFGEKHAIYARKFYEVCKVAEECTDYAIDAKITPDGLILTYCAGSLKTRVTLYWIDCAPSLYAGYEIIVPYLDRECKFRLYEEEPRKKAKRSASKRHAKYPTRPMLAKDWLASIGAVC